VFAQHALLHAYVGVALKEESRAALVSEFVDGAIEGLAQTAMRAGLYGGFTNIAWVVEHLQHAPFSSAAASETPEEDANEEIDQALLGYLSQPEWRDQYDLTTGLVGFGVYALERLPRATATQCLERVIDHLSHLARWKAEEASWWTPLELVPAIARHQRKSGHYNLGVAHGVPGIIGFLGEAHAKSPFQDKTGPLLSGAVAWLLRQRLPENTGTWFPHALEEEREVQPSRAAWCYGDPGIAATLLLAARSYPALNAEKIAVEIASSAARRDPSKCGVRDSGLCHGAAGLGHLFNRLFQATREVQFLQAARFWLARALEMRKPGDGVGGFAAWYPSSEREYSPGTQRGFLMGAGGIGLALLAAITPVEPMWDRLLLANLPPRGATRIRTGE
jgi:hypothetical protein